MSGRARLSGTAKIPLVRTEELDDNVSAYRLETDGRSAENRVQLVRMDRIEPSPFQIRRVFPETEIQELAESIRDNGLIHEPRGRPHPSRPGWVELMPGEMRLRALRRLVETGEADAVLKRDPEGNWLAPIMVVRVEDERAESMVFAENDARTDISAWEWALAWQQRRDRRRERGEPATVRDVAAAHGKPFQTVGAFLRIADQLSAEVLTAAGVAADGGADHSRMARLSMSALRGVATSADQGVDAAAARLLQELARAGDHAAAEVLQARKSAARRADLSAKQSFQINIRQSLPSLSPEQATHYLGRMAGALPILAERAAGSIPPGDAEELAAVLESTVRLLRGRS